MSKNEFKAKSNKLAELRLELEQLPQKYKKSIKLIMWRALSIVHASIIQNIRKNFKIRTGYLLNSVDSSVKVYDRGDDVIGEIGSSAIYAAIHEFGGIIKPKRAKYLAIPLNAVKSSAGIARYKPMDFRGKSFIFKSKKGSLLMAMKQEKSLELLFALKEEVKIPARPFIFPALGKNREKITEKFGIFMNEVFTFKE
jgi:phage gpG-like protein